MDTINMTLGEYMAEVRKYFPKGARPQIDIDNYFKEKDTLDAIKDAYEYRSEPECTPQAVASDLDMMY